jgi:phage baseplate assembly protein W
VSVSDDGVRTAFGVDILFTDDFQVTGSGDYALVEGEENLRRGIYRRLMTRQGDFRARPEYGAGTQSYVKKTASRANLDALRQRATEQLRLDPRIESVEEMSLELSQVGLGGAKLKVYAKVRARGRELQLEPLQFTEES